MNQNLAPETPRETTAPPQTDAAHLETSPGPQSAATEVREDDVAALARLLKQRRLRRRRGVLVTAWTVASPVAALAILLNLAMNNTDWLPVLLFGLWTARTLNRQATELDLESAAFQVYDEIGNDRLGALTEALAWPDRRVRAIARRCLMRRLPTLRAGDERFLNAEQRMGLYRYLNRRTALTQPEFVSAILKALPAIGDKRAMPGVERLARLVGFTRGIREVRASARATVGLLEQRIEQQIVQDAESSAAQNNVDIPAEAVAASLESAAQVSALPAVAASAPTAFSILEEDQKKVEHPAMRIGFLIASWCVIVPYFAVQAVNFYREGSWPAALLCALTAIGATQLHRLTLTSKHRRLAERLAKIDDVQGIGPLAEALDWPDPEVRDLVAEALTRLLPRLKASDSRLLSQQQRASLYRMLDLSNATAYAELLVAILEALQQVGDQNALPFVQRLAGSEPITTRQGRVKQAAIDCLPYLHILAEQSQYSQTLLRASSSIDAPSDLLLRSVDSSPVTDKDELLRADPR